MIVKACVTLVMLIVMVTIDKGLSSYLSPLETAAALSQVTDGAAYQQTKDIVGWARLCLHVMYLVGFCMLWMKEIDSLFNRIVGSLKK